MLNLATQNKLHDPAVLEQQVRRMLADPRSEQLVINFAGQWLSLRGLQTQAPAVAEFPDFDDNLRQAMRKETELLVDSVVHEDRPVTDLLNANYTFSMSGWPSITEFPTFTAATSGASNWPRNSICAADCWAKARS